VVPDKDGGSQVLAPTEREPYDGALPTVDWPPGSTIIEYSEVRLPSGPLPSGARLTLQAYDAGTLAKLPVTASSGVQVEGDGQTVSFPYTY
jgi:hypothetical protein